MEYDDNCLYINKVHGMIFEIIYTKILFLKTRESRDGF